MLSYRSLKYPTLPDRDAPDCAEQRKRYWQQSSVWWDNWAHNFLLSLILWPSLVVILGVMLVLVLN